MVYITVYKDTINHQYNEDDNLSIITVSKEFAELYYLEKINKEDYKTFQEFYTNYTADDTEDFYDFAKEHNAIIEIEEY